MGQMVTIACPHSWDLEVFARPLAGAVGDGAATYSNFRHQLQALDIEGRWKIILNEVSDDSAVAAEYAANDDLDEPFRQEASGLRFFTLRFDDLDVARQFLREIALIASSAREVLWIDTDYGWVIHSGEFLQEIARDDRWDWRRTLGEA